jgi:hypothetical protein
MTEGQSNFNQQQGPSFSPLTGELFKLSVEKQHRACDISEMKEAA